MVVLSNQSSVAKGETVLLACVGQGFPSVEISWWHHNQAIMNSTLVSITEEDTTQGERLYKRSFLQICNVALVDAGDYICVVSNGENSVTSSTRLIVTGTDKIQAFFYYNC